MSNSRPAQAMSSDSNDTLKRRQALSMAAASIAGAALFRTGMVSSQPASEPSRPTPGMTSKLSPEIEAAKKNAFIMIPYGMFVLAVTDGENIYAGAVNWVMQSAYAEPLFTMGVRRPGGFGFPYSDEVYKTLVKTGKFSLSFLGEDQTNMARAFMSADTVIDGNKINGYEFHTAMTGAPIINEAPAWFEAEVKDEVTPGDHSLFICSVINAGNTTEQPLLMDRDATRRPKNWLTGGAATK
ncbi:MAG: flavin reductase family protein [Pseudomonadales bacterium]